MFENGEQYAADQVLVLFVLDTLGIPVSDNHLTDLMMGPGLVNYFTYVQCLDDVVKAGFVQRRLDSMGIATYSLEEQGKAMLAAKKYMLSGGLGARYETYVSQHRNEIRQQMKIDANTFEDSQGNLFIRCFVRDGLNCIVDITLPVPSRSDAEAICKAWRSNSSAMYVEIIKAMYNQSKIK